MALLWASLNHGRTRHRTLPRMAMSCRTEDRETAGPLHTEGKTWPLLYYRTGTLGISFQYLKSLDHMPQIIVPLSKSELRALWMVVLPSVIGGFIDIPFDKTWPGFVRQIGRKSR